MVKLDEKERKIILNKIKKLIPHTKKDDCGAVNVNEMATANKLVKELMDKYDISLDEIKFTVDKSSLVSKKESLITIRKDESYWVIRLGSIVAHFYDCRVIQTKSKLLFIGFEMDAEIATDMYNYLFAQINSNAYKETKNRTSVPRKKRLEDYCAGAVHSLSDRLREIKRERENIKNQTALVVVKKDVVDNEVNKMFPYLRTTYNKMKYDVSMDYINGVRFGKTMNIENNKMIEK